MSRTARLPVLHQDYGVVQLTKGYAASIDVDDIPLVQGRNWCALAAGGKVYAARGNLRVCSHAENLLNSSRRSDNTSGFKGVSWDTRAGKWKAEIRLKGKFHFLGYFDEPTAAHAVYASAAHEMHGEFARPA